MSNLFANVQPAVKKETKKIAVGTFIGVALMWIVFGIGHMIVPRRFLLIIQYFLQV